MRCEPLRASGLKMGDNRISRELTIVFTFCRGFISMANGQIMKLTT